MVARRRPTAAIGGLIASEFILAWQASGPVFDGLALVPALIGDLLVGIVVEVVTLRHGWPVHPRGDVRLNAGLPGIGGRGPPGPRGDRRVPWIRRFKGTQMKQILA